MVEPDPDDGSSPNDLGRLQFPVFVLFAAGDLWAYPEVAQLDLDLRSLNADEVQAWDAEGRQLRSVGEQASRLLAADCEQQDRATLQSLLMEKLSVNDT